MRRCILSNCLLPAFALMAILPGCSNRPERFSAPSVDAESAASQAMELYDQNGDGSIDDEELVKVPGILGKLPLYDANKNGSVEQEEVEKQLVRMLNRVGGTPLTATVYYKGRPLSGATVTLEPEPYLGEEVRAATGVTNGAGAAPLSIPAEYMPEHLRRLKMVHYGTFKVRITHPSISIPAQYNSATELGYETEPSNPNISFHLSQSGRNAAGTSRSSAQPSISSARGAGSGTPTAAN